MESNKKLILIRKDETIRIDEDSFLTFLSHSHKKTYSDGPSSPLIIHVNYEKSGNATREEYHLDTSYQKIAEEKPGWEWEGFVFRLIDYKYNEYMQLEIYAL